MQKTNALQWKKNLISCKKIYEDAKKCFFFSNHESTCDFIMFSTRNGIVFI